MIELLGILFIKKFYVWISTSNKIICIWKGFWKLIFQKKWAVMFTCIFFLRTVKNLYTYLQKTFLPSKIPTYGPEPCIKC